MAKDTVLIITSRDEFSVAPVLGYLSELKQPYFRLDADAALLDRAVLNIDLRQAEFTGRVEYPDGRVISTSRVKSVWFRRPKPLVVTGLYPNPDDAEFAESEVRGALWSFYTNLDEVFWMNHPVPSRYVLEHNKLLQMKIAARCGLHVPETIVSNDPEAIISFCELHDGQVAIKVLRKAILSETASRTRGWIYTNIVTLDHLKQHSQSISSATLMAQEYVPKKIELRITVVGQHLFTCAIHSQDSERTRVDWRRYDFDRVKHQTYELPPHIAEQLLSFMHHCDLAFGAIDMIVTPDDNFVFLEVNPSGQYGWIEELTSLPISRTIAEVLANPPHHQTPRIGAGLV